jgi:hypothetical protein
MMNSTLCNEKADMCDAQARASVDTPLAAHWLEMSEEWRSLAADDSPQATLARLMSTKRRH